jgi:outer membrane protein, heavy metal efflux system
MAIRAFFFLLAAFATVGASQAVEITLNEAISLALKQNSGFRVFRAGIASAKGEVTTARTWQNPDLTALPKVGHHTGGGTSGQEFQGEFSLNQLFEFPGKRALKQAIAKKSVSLAQIALEGFQFQLSAKVRQAFFQLIAAETVIGLRKEQLGSAQQFAESASKRAESGFASDFEVAKSQVDLLSAKRAVTEAEGKMNEVKVGLNILIGNASNDPLVVRGTLEETAPRGTKSDFVALALARNPSLRALLIETERAGLNVRSARLSRAPDVTVGPYFEYTPQEQLYGLNISIPLPLWDQKKGRIQTASAEQQKALAELEKTRAEIIGAVTSTAANLENAKKQLELYGRSFLGQLKSVLEKAEKSYAQNETTLIIYLDAKKTYFDTLAEYYSALSNLADARAQLESAVGVPLEIDRSIR